MLSDVFLFRDGDNLFIEAILESVNTNNIKLISTIFLRKKDIFYVIQRNKKYFFYVSQMVVSELYPGWWEYEFTCKKVEFIKKDLKNTDSNISEQNINLAEEFGYIEVRDRLTEDQLESRITHSIIPDTRYMVASDSDIDVEVSMFGARSPYEFIIENVSKTGMLLSSKYSFVPFNKSTLVEIKVILTKSKCKLPDVMVTGKVAKVLDQHVAGDELRKFVGINLTQSSDVKSWIKFIEYLKEESLNG